jgi:hypothetical protein
VVVVVRSRSGDGWWWVEKESLWACAVLGRSVLLYECEVVVVVVVVVSGSCCGW